MIEKVFIVNNKNLGKMRKNIYIVIKQDFGKKSKSFFFCYNYEKQI